MQLIDEGFKPRKYALGWHLTMPLLRRYRRIEVSKLDCAGSQGRYPDIGAGEGDRIGLLNTKTSNIETHPKSFDGRLTFGNSDRQLLDAIKRR